MHVDGSCHCGEITFEAEVDPQRSVICHCADCQSLSGSAYRTVVQVAAEDFRLLEGTPSIYVKTGSTGSRRAQAFCATCASQIYATNADGPPEMYGLRVGTLAQRNDLPPQREVWCTSRLEWVQPLDVPQMDKQ
jgi:hypothetical protein